MSAGPCVSELLLLSIQVDPCGLEDLLEALADFRRPINPQVDHSRERSERHSVVEFPVYAEWLPEIHVLLDLKGFPQSSVHASEMLDHIRRSSSSMKSI